MKPNDLPEGPEADLLKESMAYLAMLNSAFFECWRTMNRSPQAGWECFENLYYILEQPIRQASNTPEECWDKAKTVIKYDEKYREYDEEPSEMDTAILREHLKEKLIRKAAQMLSESMINAFYKTGSTHATDTRRTLEKRKKGPHKP